MSVRMERDGAIAIITIDRPEALNALDVATVTTLTERLREVATDDAVRCVIVTGAGERAFIGGADIKYMSQVDRAQAEGFAAVGHEASRLLETMPKPTIAAINGFALGGGCEIALACDIRYAASTAKLGQPEVTYGLIPGWGGTQRLARTAGIGFAKELIFTGRFVGAEEALARGLVEAISDPVLERALETARQVATKSPVALREAKELCNRALQGNHQENLAAERARLADVLLHEDAREGLSAFVEKRTAAFAEPAALQV